MTEQLDLNYVFPDDDGERLALSTRVWSPPAVPHLRHPPPRLKHSAGWTPFRNHVLARTVNPFNGEYDTVLGGGRPGTVLSFHLGCVSEQPLPETRRLVKRDGQYVTLAEHEPIGAALTSLGFIGTVPFPMLDALEVRRMPDGQQVLVAGAADPLREDSEPVGTLGFVEPFPLLPRQPPAPIGRWMRPLLRWFDPVVQAHRYGSPPDRPPGAVCLGSVQTDEVTVGRHEASDYTPLVLAELAQRPGAGRLAARARWTVAPLTWNGLGRAPRVEGALERARAVRRRPGRIAQDDRPIGYIRSQSMPHHSPLYSALHPVTGDLFLTRSALEAGDLGYVDVRAIGWIADTGADRKAGADVIWWASRFGQRRRYNEESAVSTAPEPDRAGPAAPAGASTVLLQAKSAAGLARLGVAPGETRVIVRSGSDRALVVAVTHPEASLLAIAADSHARCAERCKADYLVVSLLDPDDGPSRLEPLQARYETVCFVAPDTVLGPDADPFTDPDRDVTRGELGLPFGERRERLLQTLAERGQPEGAT